MSKSSKHISRYNFKYFLFSGYRIRFLDRTHEPRIALKMIYDMLSLAKQMTLY